MAEKIPQHTHCQACGKAIPIDKTVCSDECTQKYQAFMKKRKMMIYIMYAMIAVVIGIILFSGAF